MAFNYIKIMVELIKNQLKGILLYCSMVNTTRGVQIALSICFKAQ